MDSTPHSMKTNVTVEPASHSANQSHHHQEMPIDTDEILAAYNQHAHSCNDPSHQHHHHHPHPHASLFDPEEIYGGATTEKVKRKPKKPVATDELRSENIPGHRGDQNLDELLKFINEPSTVQSKKGKKK